MRSKEGLSTEGPAYSVVIPFFNGAAFISRSLTSVENQTLKPAEIIVVNDGSEEPEADLLARELKSRPGLSIKVIHVCNGGQSRARNLGYQASESQLILFLDQDDAWLPEHAQRTVNALLNGSDAVYSDVDKVFNWCNREVVARRYNTLVSEHPKQTLKGLFGENFHVLPSVMGFRKECLESLGGFDERLSGFEDDDIVMRLLETEKRVAYLPVTGALWYEVATSASNSERMIRSRAIYFQNVFQRARGMPSARREQAERYLFFKFAPHALMDSNKADTLLRSVLEMARQTLGRSNERFVLFTRIFRFFCSGKVTQSLARTLIGIVILVRRPFLIMMYSLKADK